MKTELDCVPSHRWMVESTLLDAGSLTVVVAEGVAREEVESLKVGKAVLTGLRRIEVGADSRRFAIQFPDVVLLLVYDEGYQAIRDDDHRDEGVIGVYSQSNLLRFASSSTLIEDLVPGRVKHFDLQTSEDCYHVLGREAPIVTATG